MTTSMNMTAHSSGKPSDWVARWGRLVKPGGHVLDIACGHGRHMKWFAEHGHATLGIDRSEEALASAKLFGVTVHADIEQGPWPLQSDGSVRQFDAVVVTNYLWRALFPVITQSLSPGGILIYETFAQGNGAFGKPSNPDFLLAPGELLSIARAMRVIAFEEGFLDNPPRIVQRIVAVQGPVSEGASSLPPSYPL
jgi:SAM-dependent methyltransferase